jgi:hypothetical protein
VRGFTWNDGWFVDPPPLSFMALLGAQAMGMGQDARRKHTVGHRPLTGQQVGAMTNVSTTVLSEARFVLEKAKEKEIEAIKLGRISLNTVYRGLKEGLAPKRRGERAKLKVSAPAWTPERRERRRVHTKIWGAVRDSLEALAGLPRPLDVAEIVRTTGGKSHAIVDNNLLQALQWLEEFANVWTDKASEAPQDHAAAPVSINNYARAEHGANLPDHSDAGDGRGSSRAQSIKSAAA